MSTIEELYAQRQAMMNDPRPAAIGAAQQAQTQALRNELAQQHHPNMLERIVAARQERDEVGKDLQETRHQLAALDQATPEKGDEDAHDQRAGVLAARERRLTRQAQQLDQALARLDAELSDLVARAAAYEVQQHDKPEHNRLVRERDAKLAEIEQQKQAIVQAYAGPIGELRARIQALSAIVPIDTELLVADGAYR